MSLAVAALRLCAVKALDSVTSAGARVFDSVVDPRSLLGEEAAPTIVVYTDTGRRRPRGRDILAADGHVELAIELFVAKATSVAAADDLVVEYPPTDAGYENRLRRLAYEIDSIFSGGAGPWPELWRRVAVTFAEADSEWDRGADASLGTRFNFLRLIYRIVPIADPVRGETLPVGGFWDDFLTAAAADAELHALALDWRALIETANLPAWRARAAALGLTRAELDGIGLGPLADPPPGADELPVLAAITVDPIGDTIEADGDVTDP